MVFTGIPAKKTVPPKLSALATTQNCPLETVARLHETANKSLQLWFCDRQKENRFLKGFTSR